MARKKKNKNKKKVQVQVQVQGPGDTAAGNGHGSEAASANNHNHNHQQEKQSQPCEEQKQQPKVTFRQNDTPQENVWGIWRACMSLLQKIVSLIATLHRLYVHLVVDVCVGSIEEAIKITCREVLRQILRFVNGGSAFFISLVDDKTFWRNMRREFKKTQGPQGAWTQFWDSSTRVSSFNALFELENEGGSDDIVGKGSKANKAIKRRNSLSKYSFMGLYYPIVLAKRLLVTITALLGWISSFIVMPESKLPVGNDFSLHKLEVDVNGFLEDFSVSIQMAITCYFNFTRYCLRLILLDPSLWDKVKHEIVSPKMDAKQRRMRRSPSVLFLKASVNKRVKSTVQDTILDAGYPFEKHTVETYDGYLLDLYRIPRPESKEVVLFQHGLMDSAYGWVLRGDERALAFAAYDRGFDVFLGNFRGSPSRKCKHKMVKKYWKYSINEIGMYDITAITGKIHCIKLEEMLNGVEHAHQAVSDKRESLDQEDQFNSTDGVGALAAKKAYKLRVIAHSLGGAALLIYLSTAVKLKREHYIHRLILLSPAGIHNHKLPLVAKLLCAVDTFCGGWLKHLNFGMTVYGSILRAGAQKVAIDVSTLPGLDRLFNWFAEVMLGGDKSLWGGEMIAPYMKPYIQAMPGFSWGVVQHGHHCVNAKTFVLFDYGSKVANLEHYGSVTSPKVSDEYKNVDIPIDLVGSKRDGVVPSDNIVQHFNELKDNGVVVSYREFNLGHLGFVFDPPEEFTRYILSRLTLV